MKLCAEKIDYVISCEKRNVYQLDLGYKVIDFTFCQLLSFRKKILEKSNHTAIEDILENENFILLFVADNKHVLYLNIPQLLQLRETVLTVFNKNALV